MKADYVNPFISAATAVFRRMLGVEAERGPVTARPDMFTTRQCNILTGITGAVEGHVIYGMSLITADRIATQMLGQPVVTFDQLAASAIAELGNMITGNAATLLAEAGFPSRITPPSILRGTNVKVSTLNIPAVVIPIGLGELGEVEINVGLRECEK